MTHAITNWIINPSRILWFVFALLLIVFGFAIDGSSEPGHHAGLILGGICAGTGLTRK